MKFKSLIRSTVVPLIFLVGTFQVQAADKPSYAHEGPTLISNVRIIDGIRNSPVESQDLLLVDGKIAGIGPTGSFEVPASALTVDGKGLTAMPGLIDMHVHINGGWANGTLAEEEFQPKYDDRSIQRSLLGHLYVGVTTILDTGSERPDWTLEIQKRIKRGELMGPRAFIVGAVWTQAPSGWGADVVNEFYDLYPRVRDEFYEGPESFYQQNNFGDMSKIRANFLPNIKSAYDAGVLIAGGSDFPYPSLSAGETMHRELELLVMAGIPAIDAIKICTYKASKILRRDHEFGSLKEGMSADILIVEGNPAANISDSRNVRHVFSQGKLFDRDSLKIN